MKASDILPSGVTAGQFRIAPGPDRRCIRKLSADGEGRLGRRAGLVHSLIALVGVAVLSSCTSVEGYPQDYVATQADETAFVAYFRPALVDQYLREQGEPARRSLRNRIVYGRLAYYDMKYASFIRSINAQSNSINAGGNVTALVLTGVGAVAGTAATKSALSAASTAVLGGIGQVDKNLFYEKTMPALISAMDATRAKTLLQISRSLGDSDDAYPLAAAFIDLNRYRNAGSIPSAIGTVGAAAEVMKTDAYNQISANRL